MFYIDGYIRLNSVDSSTWELPPTRFPVDTGPLNVLVLDNTFAP